MNDLPAIWDCVEDPEARLGLLLQRAHETAQHADYLRANPPSPPTGNLSAAVARREGELERFRAWFEETNNPLWAWAALRLCLERRMVLPEWASSYFLEASKSLFDMVAKPPKRDVLSSIAKVLGFGGRGKGEGSVLRDFQDAIDAERPVGRFVRLVLLNNMLPTPAAEQVGSEFGKTKDIIFREACRAFGISGTPTDGWQSFLIMALNLDPDLIFSLLSCSGTHQIRK